MPPRVRTQPPKRSSTSGAKETNQKKSDKSEEKIQNLFVNPFMYEVIGENKSNKDSGTFYYKLCPGKPQFDFGSVHRHILESQTHNNLVTSQNH